MPAWDSVNPVKTPKAYRGISFDTLPPKATISPDAISDRNTIPFEYTSRSP